MKRLTLTTSAIALSFMIAACAAPEKADEATLDTSESVEEVVAEADHTVEIAEARAFLERAEAELAAQSRIASRMAILAIGKTARSPTRSVKVARTADHPGCSTSCATSPTQSALRM